MKKMIIAFIVTFFMFANVCTSFAAEFSCNIDAINKTVYVKAKDTQKISGKRFKFILLKPDVNADSMDLSKLGEYVHHIYQGITGKDGVISYDFDLVDGSPSGYYSGYLAIENEETETALNIFYAGDDLGDEVAGKIDNPEGSTLSEKIDFIGSILNDEHNREILNLDETWYKNLTNKSAVFKMLANENFGGTRKAFNELMNKIVFLCAVNEGLSLSEVLDYYSEKLGYSEKNVYKIFKSYPNNISLKDSNPATIDEVFEKLAYELIELKLSKTLRWEKTIDVLKEFTEETEISFSLYNTLNDKHSAISLFLSTGRNKLSDEKVAFDKAVAEIIKKEKEKDPSPSGGGGGGGGGRTTGDVVYPIKIDDLKDNYTPDAKQEESLLSDISGHWAEKEINFLANKKIINGFEDNRFLPEEPISREQFVKILVTAFSLPSFEYNNSFYDIPSDRWSAVYVSSAEKTGVVNGNGNGLFEPERKINRQELCTMLGRCLEYKGVKISDNKVLPFIDDNETSDYARKYIAFLLDNKVVNGVGNNMFEPNGDATRAMAAKIVYGALSYTGVGGAK